MRQILRRIGRGIRYTAVAVGALVLSGGVIATADYLLTQGAGTTFASLVISTKHYIALVICDATAGESQCGAVKAGNTAATTDIAQVVSDPNVLAAVQSSVPIGTSGGITPLKLNALTNTAVAIKASAGQLFLLQCGNPNSSEEYVQVYNVASGSVTVGTTAPTLSVPIAATATGGFALSLQGLQFGTAISVAATTTATGGTAPGTALDCNAGYN